MENCSYCGKEFNPKRAGQTLCPACHLKYKVASDAILFDRDRRKMAIEEDTRKRFEELYYKYHPEEKPQEEMMPSEQNIKVALDYRHYRWQAFAMFARPFGIGSILSRFVWWLLEPVRVKVGKRPWRPIRFEEWGDFHSQTGQTD